MISAVLHDLDPYVQFLEIGGKGRKHFIPALPLLIKERMRIEKNVFIEYN
jgi:hypothetical protein